MVAIFFLPAAGEDKVLKAEAAALHPIAGELNVIIPVRRLRVGVQAPLGYSVLLYPAPLQAAALVNGHEGSQARLLKYESILLLVLRLLYLQKRESLAANADEVLVTVEEVQTELQKMNLPRRLDQKTLENLMRTLRRYNLARPVGRLTGLDSRIEVFPTVLLALPDADLADAAAESGRTRTELGLYERADEAGEGEE